MTLIKPPSPRVLIAVTGSDAKPFLQGMITNDMELLADDPAIYAALLTPQGKVISTFFVVGNPDGGYWLDCPVGAAEVLLKRLCMFRLRADVVFEDGSKQWQVRLSETQTDGLCYPDPRHPKMGFRTISPCSPEPTSVDDTGFIQNFRFTCMVPEQDVEYSSGEVFPSDINMDLQNGVAWRKGCYVGQEVVSRMKRRGSIRKRMGVVTAKELLPETGAEIFAGKSKIGHICSSQNKQGLAMVRTDRLDKARETEPPITADGQSLTLKVPKESAK